MSDTLPRPIAREQTRHPISIEELLAMEAAGQFRGLRTQLLDGEIHVMPSDGLRHINYTMELAARVIMEVKPRGYFIGVQTSLHLSRYNAPSPDIYVLTAGPPRKNVRAERILLVVEVAVSSLRDDLRDSASRYARHGVREFWVVDVAGRRSFVHTNPQAGAYPEPRLVPFETALAPALIPGLSLRLADFDPPEALDEDDED